MILITFRGKADSLDRPPGTVSRTLYPGAIFTIYEVIVNALIVVRRQLTPDNPEKSTPCTISYVSSAAAAVSLT